MADKNDNLLKGNPGTQFKSGRYAAEMGRRGGLANGETQKQRKAFKQVFGELLEKPLTAEQVETLDPGVMAFAESNGVTPNEIMAVVMMLKAMKGDTKAFEIVRDTIGEKPADKQELNIRELPKISVVRKDG